MPEAAERALVGMTVTGAAGVDGGGVLAFVADFAVTGFVADMALAGDGFPPLSFAAGAGVDRTRETPRGGLYSKGGRIIFALRRC